MDDRILFKSETLAEAASELNRLLDSLNDVTRDFGRVNTSEEWWTKLNVSTSHGRVSAISAVRNLRSDIGKTLDYAADISKGVKKTAEMFNDADRDIARMADRMYSKQDAFDYQAGGGGFNGAGASGGGNPNAGSNDDRSWFAKFLNNQIKSEGAWKKWVLSEEHDFFGIGAGSTISGSFLAWEAGIKGKAKLNFKNEDGSWNTDTFGVNYSAYATGALAKGEVERNFGILNGKLTAEAGTVTVSGNANFTIFEDGSIRPSISIGAKAEASAVKGEYEGRFGNDQFGYYNKAEGHLLHAEAEAKAGAGYRGTDEKGNALYGFSAEASAMASLAQGRVEGGFSIFGIDIGLGVTGYAGAAGVEAGGSITTEGATASFGGALGLGGKMDITVDWSDAEWIGDAADTAGEFIGGAVDTASEFIGNAGEAIGDIGEAMFGWIW